MAELPAEPPMNRARPPIFGIMPPGDEPGDARLQADRVDGERLIRSAAQALANGAPIRDLDGLVSRNLGSITPADIRAGRLGANVLGDIIGEVERAKGGKPFNWSAATHQEIKAYLANSGLAHLGAHLDGSRARPGGDTPGTDAPGSDGAPRGYSILKTTWDPNSGGLGLTRGNFGGTPFAGAGLDLNTTQSMFNQGFNMQQIIKAANDTHDLGIDPKEDAPRIARLNRDAPQFLPKAKVVKRDADGLVNRERSIVENERHAAELRKKGDTAGAAKLDEQNNRLREQQHVEQKHYEEHRKGALAVVPKQRQDDAGTVLRHIDEQMHKQMDRIHSVGTPGIRASSDAGLHPLSTPSAKPSKHLAALAGAKPARLAAKADDGFGVAASPSRPVPPKVAQASVLKPSA